jgi:hypothetical protein
LLVWKNKDLFMESSPRLHLPSLFQFALSGLALLVLVPAGILLGVVGLIDQFRGGGQANQAISVLSLAGVALFVSVLLLPSGVLALFRLIHRQPPAWQIHHTFRWATWALALWVLALALGALVTRTPAVTWLFLPLLQILAIGIPIWWIVELGRRGLNIGSSQRAWGILGFGLVVNPTLIIILELLLMVVLAFAALAWVSSQPALLQQLTQLGDALRSSGPNPDAILNILKPYLQQPLVIFSGIAILSVLMPMIEEMFKPWVLWFLAPRGGMTPAQGFVAGLISGGAFGLIESLTLATNVSDISWLSIVVTRFGTGLLHSVTTGLMGWAIVSALNEKHYVRLGLTYLLAVGLHGLWNLFGVFLGAGPLLPANVGNTMPFATRLVFIAPAALGVLVVLLFVILIGANRRLQEKQSSQNILVEEK